MDHRLSEGTVSIPGRGSIGEEVVPGDAVEEGARVLKNQLRGALNDQNPLAAGVVLVGDAVVQGLQHDALVVFAQFHRDHLAGGGGA